MLSEGRVEDRLAGELGLGREQITQRWTVAVQVAQLDERAGGSPVEERRLTGRRETGVPERAEPLRLSRDVVDPVADVVHTSRLRDVQRGARDRLPDFDGEWSAEGEGDVAFHVVRSSARVDER